MKKKNLQNSQLLTIFRNPLKSKAKNKNYNCYKLLGSIFVHIQAKYRKDQMKTEGA